MSRAGMRTRWTVPYLPTGVSIMCHLFLRFHTCSNPVFWSSPSNPPLLVNQATSRLALHWLFKWNIILARYGEVELADLLTTNCMPGNSPYMRTWSGLFPRVCDSVCCTAVLLQYLTHTVVEKSGFDGHVTSLWPHCFKMFYERRSNLMKPIVSSSF